LANYGLLPLRPLRIIPINFGKIMRNEQEKGVVVMSTNYAYNLNEVRENLLREYITATGAEKIEILTKIIEIDEEIESAGN